MQQRVGEMKILIGGAALIVMAWLGYGTYERHSTEALRAGIMAFKSGDYEKVEATLSPFAIVNHPEALRTLGEMYARGLGVKKDEIRAIELFRRAECRCNTPGEIEYGMARLLIAEISKEDNRHKAAFWLVKAAEAGHPEAQAILSNREKISSLGLPVEEQTFRYWSARHIPH
jgi:TPR repeat protein